MLYSKSTLQQNCRGFGLVELIIALGLFLIIVSVGAIGVVGSLSAQQSSETTSRARAVAQEALEATQFIREQDWSNLAVGTYGLDDTPGTWQFAGTSDTVGKYSRSIHITSVERDGSGTIVVSGGTTDADTLKARVEVTWTDYSGRSRSYSQERYFTHWDKTIPVAGGFVPAKFCGVQSTSGTNLTLATAAPIRWNFQSYDDAEYSYSAGTPTRVSVDESGDYVIGLHFPYLRGDNRNSRTRIDAEVRKNGTLVTGGSAQSSYIRNANDHTQSSDTLFLLIPQVQAGEYLEVYVRGTAETNNVTVTMDGTGCIMLKRVSSSDTVFAATSNTATGGTDLNVSPASLIQWTEQRKDSGYTHSNATNSQEITVQEAGNYFVAFNLPMTSSGSRSNLLCSIRINGTPVTGATCAQGYIRNSNNDSVGSIHWSGVITVPAGGVLTTAVEQEAAVGTVNFNGNASLFLQKLPPDSVLALQGTQLLSGTEWNPSTPSTINWQTQQIIDSAVYSHSPATNPDTVTILEQGTYLLSFSTAVNSNTGRPNIAIQVLKNGTPISGAVTSSFYIRGAGQHDTSSGNMILLLEDMQPNDTLQLRVTREADNDSFTNYAPAQLVLWKQ